MTNKGVEFERLEEAIKALNDLGLVEKIEYSVEEGFDPQEVLGKFMKATEAIPFEKEKELPDIVVDLYNEIADKVKEEAAVSECEMYGTGWDSKLGECKQCRKDYPDEYERCKGMSQAKNKGTVSEKVTKKQEKSTPSKPNGTGKNMFGRRVDSRYGRLDALLGQGATIDQMSAMLADDFDLSDAAKARGVIKGHMKSACKAEGVEIKELSGGIFKYAA